MEIVEGIHDFDYRPWVRGDRNHSKGYTDLPGHSAGQGNGSGWIATMR
jgi:hypothetical protein